MLHCGAPAAAPYRSEEYYLPAEQGDRAGGPGAIPGAPETALPRLAALSRAPPSSLLQWQLLEILYAYCSTMHLFQGDWAFDAVVRHPHDGCSVLNWRCIVLNLSTLQILEDPEALHIGQHCVQVKHPVLHLGRPSVMRL